MKVVATSNADSRVALLLVKPAWGVGGGNPDFAGVFGGHNLSVGKSAATGWVLFVGTRLGYGARRSIVARESQARARSVCRLHRIAFLIAGRSI